MRIDLHTHSRASDGTQSPAELVHAAVAADLDVLALTDHDTADGWDEAAGAASAAGCGWCGAWRSAPASTGQGVHLLAYLPDASYPPLAAGARPHPGGPRSRVPGMLEGLRGAGIDLTEADVARVSGHSVASGRPHVADALVALGVVADRTEAFDRLLSPGRPGYVDRYAAPLRDMIGLVTAAGGVSVVAHVWGRRHDECPDARALAELAGLGLAGIEVDHQDHAPAARERLRGDRARARPGRHRLQRPPRRRARSTTTWAVTPRPRSSSSGCSTWRAAAALASGREAPVSV